ncbi:hypothetical protein [Desulfovibrio sp. ZJ200]|uniref:hypothetical protein n=1 Tax=Desulfovibrio sp. ZJ200 TaxID=2709792 RepID=UPI00197DFDB6|nr:hypothetical protein [Desulfovibrio sp. ZJ200]
MPFIGKANLDGGISYIEEQEFRLHTTLRNGQKDLGSPEKYAGFAAWKQARLSRPSGLTHLVRQP